MYMMHVNGVVCMYVPGKNGGDAQIPMCGVWWCASCMDHMIGFDGSGGLWNIHISPLEKENTHLSRGTKMGGMTW